MNNGDGNLNDWVGDLDPLIKWVEGSSRVKSLVKQPLALLGGAIGASRECQTTRRSIATTTNICGARSLR